MKGAERQCGKEKRIVPVSERWRRHEGNDEGAWKSGDDKKIKENES